MSIMFIVVPKVNPTKRNAAPKYYAIANSDGKVD